VSVTTPSLFNFRLTPLEHVVPWGEPGAQTLHWFGLTDGEYWMQVGADALFEYSEFARTATGCLRYCNYQIVRLYEDITGILPYILDPVPPSLVPYLSGDSGAVWRKNYLAWQKEALTDSDENRFWDLADAAGMWISNRTLDTSYLRQSPDVRIWSDTENVHIEWNNIEKTLEGKPVWTALSGSAQLSREEFISEAQAFHDALMSQMGERVERVLAGVLPQHVQIDLPGLKREHAERSRTLERELSGPTAPTDWERVRHAVREVERFR
jgi:hypothetical protein